MKALTKISILGLTAWLATPVMADDAARALQLQNAQSESARAQQTIQQYNLLQKQKLDTTLQNLSAKGIQTQTSTVTTTAPVTEPPAQQTFTSPTTTTTQPVQNRDVTGFSNPTQDKQQSNGDWKYGF